MLANKNHVTKPGHCISWSCRKRPSCPTASFQTPSAASRVSTTPFGKITGSWNWMTSATQQPQRKTRRHSAKKEAFWFWGAMFSCGVFLCPKKMATNGQCGKRWETQYPFPIRNISSNVIFSSKLGGFCDHHKQFWANIGPANVSQNQIILRLGNWKDCNQSHQFVTAAFWCSFSKMACSWRWRRIEISKKLLTEWVQSLKSDNWKVRRQLFGFNWWVSVYLFVLYAFIWIYNFKIFVQDWRDA